MVTLTYVFRDKIRTEPEEIERHTNPFRTGERPGVKRGNDLFW